LWKDETLSADTDGIRLLDARGRWTPQLQIVGDMALRKLRAGVLEVSPDGTVELRERYSGTMSSRMDVSDFPLDRQAVRITIVSPIQPPVTFLVDDSDTGQSEILTVADWKVTGGRAYVKTFHVMEHALPSVVYVFEAERHFGYYLWKVIIPLALIVFMSWSVFWIDPSAFGPQIGAATASMLTLIAYRFALGGMVPKISYFTRMDVFITGATMMVFFALLQAITTSRLATADRQRLAQRMDDVCRWFFPAAFVFLCVFSFVI